MKIDINDIVFHKIARNLEMLVVAKINSEYADITKGIIGNIVCRYLSNDKFVMDIFKEDELILNNFKIEEYIE